MSLRLKVTRSPSEGILVGMSRFWPQESQRAGQMAGLVLEGTGKKVIAGTFKTHQAGGLAADWRKRDTVESGTNWIASAGSRKPYAAIQHYGGTILPRTVSRLAVPLLDTLRSSAMWPRDFPAGQFYSTSPPGVPGALIDRQSGEAWYALVLSVFIPPTRYVTTIAQRARPQLRALVSEAVKRTKIAAGGAA